MVSTEQASVARPRARILTAASRPEYVPAPFALRCGAWLIDYSLAVGLLAFVTLVTRMFGRNARSSGDAIEIIGYLLAGAIVVLNFVALPALIGQTCGKWAAGLRIRRVNGEKLGVVHALVRHTVGYALSLVLFGLGFFLAIFDREGRALHDRLAGTIVVEAAARSSGGKRR